MFIVIYKPEVRLKEKTSWRLPEVMSCIYLEYSTCDNFSLISCASIFTLLTPYLTSLRDISCSDINSSSSKEINMNAFIFAIQGYGWIVFSSIIQERRVERFSLFILLTSAHSFTHSFKIFFLFLNRHSLFNLLVFYADCLWLQKAEFLAFLFSF